MSMALRTVLTRCVAFCILTSLYACGGGHSASTNSALPPTTGGTGNAVGGLPVTITEFPITGDTLPEAITVARDGNPWFLTLNHVNRMTPAGVITPFTGPIAPGGTAPEFNSYSPANDITIGPDNAVWFTADGAGADVNPLGCMQVGLLRIAPNAPAGTNATAPACPGARQHGNIFQAGIVAGPGGTIWMVNQNGGGLGSNGSAYESIETNGTVLFFRDLPAPCTEFALANPYFATGLTAGPGNAVYVAAGSPCAGTGVVFASSAVIRIDAAGNVTNVFLVPDAIRITSGPDGNLWVTQNGATNAIARVTPSGTVTEFPIPTPNAQPLGITAGNDGAIWFTEKSANKIGRITVNGVMTEYSIPTANSQPYGIASLAGACGPGHGLIWFTEATSDKIGKIEF